MISENNIQLDNLLGKYNWPGIEHLDHPERVGALVRKQD